MKEPLSESRQPLSKLDREFEGFRIRTKHIILLFSIAAGLSAAAFVRDELSEEYLGEDEIYEEAHT